MSILREYLPLKQGLRHTRQKRDSKRAPVLREYLPLKQGLRPDPTGLRLLWLREYLPLKQGLRPYPTGLRLLWLREYLPLKQGLRQGSFCSFQALNISESIFH